MSPARVNALTDGVVAIVLTIMVLELKFPAQPTLAAAAAVGEAGERRGAVGQFRLALLADPDPARHPLDRRCGHHALAGRRLRPGAHRRFALLPDARTEPDHGRGRRIAGQARGRRGVQGADQLRSLYFGDPARV